MNELAQRLAARIRDEGPIPYSTFVDTALYDAAGFYAVRGSAGRRGDFITSAEVGPLFGAVLANALDDAWRTLGRPDPFRVIECGAGRGTLARAIVAAAPACGEALDYVLVERSDRLRSDHPSGAPWRSLAELPVDAAAGVVLANELLDNLGFDLLEWRDDGWHEVRVDVDATGGLREVLTVYAADVGWLPVAPDVGGRVPVQQQAAEWLRLALDRVAPGRVVVIDYADTTASFVQRPWLDWLRTYRGHDRGGHPVEAPGSQDITCEVAIDQLAAVREVDRDRSQAEFLVAHGIEDLVNEGRRIWQERAHLADLAAIRARSRIRESEALLDPAGLGAFRVLEWHVA